MAMIWAIVFCFPLPGQTPSNTNIGWQMYNGNYSGDRFSPLKQITRENVARILRVAAYEIPEKTSNFQSGPVWWATPCM
jgi:hypothetical protein